MTDHAVLTTIGADRPGLVEEVSEFIYRQGGNIEDSRMANLRGQFAMMLLVKTPGDTLRKMQTTLPTLIQQSGLHIEIRSASALSPMSKPALPYRLHASALDQAGLVHRVAHLLHSMDINIENMQTSLVAAPYTGAPVFEIDMTISIPGELPLSRLRENLGLVCDELNIDWRISAI